MTDGKGASMTKPIVAYKDIWRTENTDKAVMMRAHGLCPTALSHPEKMEWMASYFRLNSKRENPAPAPADDPKYDYRKTTEYMKEMGIPHPPAGAPDVAPIAWCVRYDGPPSYDGIHSNPTMHKPEAEALAARAGLVLVELVPADALAALQSHSKAIDAGMTQEELQDLSRKAANLLSDSFYVENPKWYASKFPSWHGGENIESTFVPAGTLGLGETWLYESTEACTEILVRVLWPENVTVVPLGNGCAPCNGSGWIDVANKTEGDDHMQAFRTAVLLALVEVMG